MKAKQITNTNPIVDTDCLISPLCQPIKKPNNNNIIMHKSTAFILTPLFSIIITWIIQDVN